MCRYASLDGVQVVGRKKHRGRAGDGGEEKQKNGQKCVVTLLGVVFSSLGRETERRR